MFINIPFSLKFYSSQQHVIQTDPGNYKSMLEVYGSDSPLSK